MSQCGYNTCLSCPSGTALETRYETADTTWTATGELTTGSAKAIAHRPRSDTRKRTRPSVNTGKHSVTLLVRHEPKMTVQ